MRPQQNPQNRPVDAPQRSQDPDVIEQELERRVAAEHAATMAWQVTLIRDELDREVWAA